MLGHSAGPGQCGLEATLTAAGPAGNKLAFEVIGRLSYKNSAAPERRAVRAKMLRRLEAGQTRLAMRLRLSAAQRLALLDDSAGDGLDAVLCLLQAAWASRQPQYGLSAGADPVEGWIVSAGALSRKR